MTDEHEVKEKQKELEQARQEFYRAKYRGLSINRIPANTREAFISYAYRYHDGDYGQALQYVFDVAMRFVPHIEQLEHYCHDLERRLSTLEGNDAPKKRTIRSISGKHLEA